jgi:hypothetical protein
MDLDRKMPAHSLLFTWLFSLVIGLFSCQSSASPPVFFVGTAVANITPPLGACIAGDANGRTFTGVHDSLYLKTVVVSDGKTRIAFITADCIGLQHPTVLAIRKGVAAAVPNADLDPSHLVIASTHTHSGPDVVGLWGPNPWTSGVDTSYQNALVKKAIQAVVQALANQQEATAICSEGTHGDSWVVNISDTTSVDRSIVLLQFIDRKGNSIASLLNFACHPTFLDNASDWVSADYVAGVYKQMDEQLGGVNLFLQGAIGGWVQPEYEEKTFAAAERRGRELADAGLKLLKNSQPLDSALIRFKSKLIQLPVSNPGFKQLAAIGVLDRPITDSVTTEIAWFSIGNVQFATHPGETTPVHSLETKALMRQKGPKVVIGLGMDALGYLLSPHFFDPQKPLPHTGYLLSRSIDPAAGPLLMEQLREIAR